MVIGKTEHGPNGLINIPLDLSLWHALVSHNLCTKWRLPNAKTVDLWPDVESEFFFFFFSEVHILKRFSNEWPFFARQRILVLTFTIYEI